MAETPDDLTGSLQRRFSMKRRVPSLEFVYNRRSALVELARQMGQEEDEYEDSHNSQPNRIRISNGGLRLDFFNFEDKNHVMVMCVKTNEPVLPSNGIEYFELKVYMKKRDFPATIAVGLSMAGQSHNMPGHERGSFGYQCEDGSFCCSTGTTASNLDYGPRAFDGDTIGCGVDFVNNSLFFTKNGIHLGVAYSGKQLNRRFLYFTVGIKGSCVNYILANFGSSPFAFDLENLVKNTKKLLVEEIDNTKLPSYPQNDAIDFNQIVSSYLVDNSYISTAEAFSRATGVDISGIDEAKYRLKIRQHILGGRVSEAINLVNRRYPDFFKTRETLLFHLRLQEFVDKLMSLRHKLIDSMETDELTYSTDIYLEFSALHTHGCEISRHHDDLISRGFQDEQTLTNSMKQAFALLAYNKPEESPFSNLLSPSARHNLWEEMKEALLECNGRSKFNVLKTLVGYNSLLMKIMTKADLGAPAFLENLVFED